MPGGSSRAAARTRDDAKERADRRQTQRAVADRRGAVGDRRLASTRVITSSRSLHRWLVRITMAGHSENPLAHVVDHDTLELPWWNPPDVRVGDSIYREILGFQITRFMVMELIAAVLVIVILVPVVRHIATHAV